jgi:hypothetical protein
VPLIRRHAWEGGRKEWLPTRVGPALLDARAKPLGHQQGRRRGAGSDMKTRSGWAITHERKLWVIRRSFGFVALFNQVYG